MRLQVRSLALLSQLRIWCCPELWCRWQTLLGSCIAVALAWAGSYSSDWTPSLGNSICRRFSPRKDKKKKKKKINQFDFFPGNISSGTFCPLALIWTTFSLAFRNTCHSVNCFHLFSVLCYSSFLYPYFLWLSTFSFGCLIYSF